jgi:hypothetical protein
LLLFQIKSKNNMVEIVNGRVFVEGVETIDPTLIGLAVLDYAETQENDNIKIVLKEEDVFVESLITVL